ncbi:MAG: hypothetical protein VCA36_01770, partial [Opitutales bacterium]
AVATASQAIELICELSAERPSWREGSIRFRSDLKKGGWQVPQGDSPVVPLLLGEVRIVVEMAKRLKAGGVLAGMIRPPTVLPGTSRLRFSLKANLDYAGLAGRIVKLLGILRA